MTSKYEDLFHRDLLAALKAYDAEAALNDAEVKALAVAIVAAYFDTTANPPKPRYKLVGSKIVAWLWQLEAGPLRDTIAELLRGLLQDEDATIRRLATYGLTYLRVDDKAIAPTLVERTHHDSDILARTAALILLAEIDKGDPKLPAQLLAALGRATSGYERGQIIGALAEAGKGNHKVEEALWHILRHGEDDVLQGYAAYALVDVGVLQQAVVEAIIDIVKHDKTGSTHLALGHALGNLGQGSVAAVATMLYIIEHSPDAIAPKVVAEKLIESSGDNPMAIAGLLEIVSRPCEWVTSFWQADSDIPEVLEKAANSRQQIVETMLRLLNSEFVEVRGVAAQVLGRHGSGSEAVDALLGALRRGDAASLPIIASLAGIGVGNKQVIGALLGILQSESSDWYRHDAAEALGKVGVGNQVVADALLHTLQHDAHDGLREAATQSLGEIGVSNTTIIAALINALQTGTNVGERRAAAEALGKLRPDQPEAANVLLTAFQRDEDFVVQQKAATALGAIAASDPIIIQALLDRMNVAFASAQEGATKSGRERMRAASLLSALIPAIGKLCGDRDEVQQLLHDIAVSKIVYTIGRQTEDVAYETLYGLISGDPVPSEESG